MAYKRYFKRNGKTFGPYYYESYRDENGDVKKRYIGKINPDKKKISVGKLVLGGLVLLAVIAVVSVSVQAPLPEIGDRISGAYDFVRDFASGSVTRIVGFVVEDGEEEEVAPQEEEPEPEEPEEETVEEEPEVVEDEVEEEIDVGVIGGVEEVAEEEVVEEELEVVVEIPEEVVESLEEEVEEEVEENVTKVEEEVVEENVTEVVEEPSQVPSEEDNVTEVEEENVTEVEEPEVVVADENVTVVNVTEENVTEVVNVTGVNVSVKQYKAVINRPVKWIKKLVVVEDGVGDYSVEIPLEAENVSVISGEEVAEAEAEIEKYDSLVEGVDREDIVDGSITGFVAKDIRSGQGILTRVWEWIRGFTISGDVISEVDLIEGGDIVETVDAKVVDLGEVVEAELAKGPEAEVAVEYYTDAPLAEESSIDRGKKVVVSADDVLNYTEILAYTSLDNRIRMNSSRLKVVWLKEVESLKKIKEDVKERVKEEKEARKEERRVEKEKEKEAKKEEKENVTGEEVVEEEPEVVEEEIVIEEEEPVAEEEEIDTGIIGGVEVVEEEIVIEEEEPVAEEEVVEEVTKEEEKEAKKEEKAEEKEAKKEEDFVSVITGEVVRSVDDEIYEVGTEVERVEVNYTVYDLDEDGFVDYVEWIVPHLSNQSYEIIYISGAEHLDSNRTFVEDIFEDVNAKDDVWSKVIPADDYVRVSFEAPLDNSKDITLYARGVGGLELGGNESNATVNDSGISIVVYRENENESVVVFENVSEEEWYKVLLTNLSVNESLDTFDLLIRCDLRNESNVTNEGCGVEFDYIVDPEIVPAAETGLVGLWHLNEVTRNMELDYGSDVNLTGNVLLMHFNNDSSFGENDTVVYDFSGNGNNGSVVNEAVFTTSGKKGAGAYSFDESGDRVTTDRLDAINHSEDYTLCAWVKYNNPDSRSNWLFAQTRVGASDRFSFTTLSSSTPRLYFGHYNGTSYFAKNGNTKLFADIWYHVCAVNDGTNKSDKKIYLDGQAETLSDAGSLSPGSNPVDFTIGANPESGIGLDGSVDEVAVWDRSLSAVEIEEIYDRGRVDDDSGQGNHGNSTGPMFNSTGGILGTGALEFDGDGDIIRTGARIAEIDNSKAYSVAFWLKPEDVIANGFVVSQTRSSAERFSIWTQSTGGVGANIYYGHLNNSDWLTVGGIFLSADVWYHVVAVQYVNNSHILYVDGALADDTMTNSGQGQSSSNDPVFYIGSNTQESNVLNGTLDELAIYNRTLNASEVLLLYNLGANVSQFTNVWNCSTDERFDNASCWSKGAVPVAYDDVVFNGTGTGDCNVTRNSMPQYLNSFLVDGSYGAGTLTFNPLFAAGDIEIQYKGVSMTGNILLMHFNNDSSVGENDTVVYDWSGEGNNGSVVNDAVFTTDGHVGAGAYSFDGTGDYVDVGTTFSAIDDTKNFSIAFDAKFDNPQNRYNSLISQVVSGSDRFHISTSSSSNPQLSVYYYNGSDVYTMRSDYDLIIADTWSSFVVVHNADINVFTVYHDGVNVSTSGSGTSPGDSVQSFKIGGNTYTGDFHNGSIDEVAVWNRSLTSAEVEALYLDGSQKWNVTSNITVNNGTVKVWGDYPYNTSVEGNGQEWRSVSGNISIGSDASLDGVGLGFPQNVWPVGTTTHFSTYGNATGPTSLGCGGTGPETKGGAAIKLQGSNVIVDGDISMSGTNRSADTPNGGCGGSIWIYADNISGSGDLDVDGGRGYWGGGPGEGGYIRFDFTSLGYDGVISTKAGGQISGAAEEWNRGRLGIFSFTNNTYPSDWTLTGDIGLAGGNYTVNGNFVVLNGTILSVHPVNDSAADNGQGVMINAGGNITVEPTGEIRGLHEGFTYDSGPGGCGAWQGATHGGKGNDNADAVYGSVTEPTSLGSSSSGTAGWGETRGGGAIKLETTENIVIDGNINMSVRFSAGGSMTASAGGSILLVAGGNLSGSGYFDVSGGNTDPAEGAAFAGGGGRIALYGSVIDFSGVIDNEGGLGTADPAASGGDGGGGTVYINSTSSILFPGNVTVTGFDGGNMTFIDSFLNLSGYYNASTINASEGGDGVINVSYSDCGSVFGGTFDPSAIFSGSCAPMVSVVSPLNDSTYNTSSIVYNVSSSVAVGSGNIVGNIDDSLVGWWRMDEVNDTGEGALVQDYFSVYNGTAVGNAVQTDAGKFGKGFVFDGVGDEIIITSPDLVSNLTDMTVMAWVKMTEEQATTSGDEGIVSQDDDTPRVFELRRRANEGFGLLVYNDTGVASQVNTDTTYTDTGWHHVVGVKNSTHLSIYIDGSSDATPVSMTDALESGTSVFQIGGSNGGNFNGTIDDVMIWNRSLSAEEILSLYNATALDHTETLADGAHTFRAYTQDLAGNLDDSGLIGFSVYASPPSVVFGIDVLSNGSQTANDWIWMNVSVNDSNTNVSAFVDYDNSLVSWWRMDEVNTTGEGALVQDYFSLNNGTAVGNAVQTDAGYFGKGFSFDGAGDYVLLDDNGDGFGKHICVNGCSFSAWAKKADLTSEGSIITRFDSAGDDGFWRFFVDASEHTRFWFGSDGDTPCTTNYIDGDIVQDVWYHYVAVFDNSTGTGNISVYRDGVHLESVTCGFSGIDVSAWQDDEDVFIGVVDDSSYGAYWNGTIDDVMVFNRSLSADEILGLYANTSSKYVTNNYTGVEDGWHTFKPYVQNLVGSVATLDARWIQKGVNTGLDAFDSEDDSENKYGWLSSEDEPLPTETTYFFANYTSNVDGSAVANGICSVSFSGGSVSNSSNMTYNSSAGLYVYNRSFDYSGNYSWNVSCSKTGHEVQNSSAEGDDVRIRVGLFSNSTLGLTTGAYWINYNEDVNVSVDLQSAIDTSSAGYNVSSAWISILKPDTSSENVSLSAQDGDGADGGVWNSSWDHSASLGDYVVTYFANLTNTFDVVRSIVSRFSVQNTSITISTGSSTNTTAVMSVNGQINRTNGTANWTMPNNLFVIKLNNVTVSSNTLNHTNFTGGNGTDMNLTAVAQLNLTTESSVTSYTDDYTTNGYLTAANSYYNESYDAGDGTLFELDGMVSQVGNITYVFSSITKYYNASAYVVTDASPSDPGANTSVWYSFDDVSYTLLEASTSSGATIGGTIPVDGYTEFYVKVESDVSASFDKENPVTSIEINHTSWDYASIGDVISPAINLANITYTVLRWSESLPSGSDIKVQMRESDDGSGWDAWGTNYTSGLDNDITALSKDYVQYRAWLSTTNGSVTPTLSAVRILYFNATTDATGAFDYNVTIPTDSLGVVPLEVTVNENPTTGIVGTKSQDLTVWAVTSLPYTTVANYSGAQTNYSVTFNFTRVDTGALVPGDFNISIGNGSLAGVQDSQQCSGVGQCTAWWLVPGNLSYGNYTINASAWNESGYYLNISNGYADYLEERNTTGTLYVENETLTDYNPAATYELYVNATINNTGNASMLYVSVFDYAAARGDDIASVTEVTPCARIYPNSSCNATMLVTLSAGAEGGTNFVSWRANWTNNDGSIAEGGVGYITYTGMYIDISLDASMSINESVKNMNVQHNSSGAFNFDVNSTGTDTVANIEFDVIEENISVGHGNLSSSWVVFTPSSITSLTGGNGQSVNVNVSVPVQTSPGNYSGTINVSSSNTNASTINLTVEVPVNGSWYVSPVVNLTNNNTFGLNENGTIGNVTVYNTGNVNLSFALSYSNSRTTDYSAFGTALFEEDQNVGGIIRNPTQLNVTKGGSAMFSMFQKGNSNPLPDIGVDVVWSNSNATPTSGSYQDAWYIIEQPPSVTDVWFILDGVNGSISESNKDLVIKFATSDDIGMNLTASIVNVTYGGTTDTINATDLCNDECEGSTHKTVVNYTANFTPTADGLHTVVIEVYDEAGNNGTVSGYSFTNYRTVTGSVALNDSSVLLSKVDRTNGENVSINFTLTNTGMVYMYSPVIGFNLPGNVSASNASLSDLAAGASESVVVSFNVSAMSAPGNYVVPVVASWTNPDTSSGSDGDSLTIIVNTNRSLGYDPASITLVIPSGATNSSLMTVNNTGNVILTSVNFTCQSGDVCSAFTLGVNDSAFSIPINSSRTVNVSFTTPAGYTGGNYNGVVNISAIGISDTFNVFTTVPETWTWSALPSTVNGTKVAGTNGELQAIVINVTGNMDIVFTLNSTNDSLVTPNVSTISVSAGSAGTFMINHTAPAIEGVYLANVTIGNSSADPVTDIIRVNLTATDVAINISHPTNESQITNVTSGDNVSFSVNATYGGILINDSSTWSATINGTACANASSFFDSNNTYWNVSCLAPSLTDGTTYNLSLTLTHATYGVVSELSADSIVYRDTSAPSFNVTRNHVALNGNINLSVNVSDNIAIDDVWGTLTYPNGSVINLTFASSGGFYINNSFALDLTGEYVVNYSANDTTGNLNSTTDWFEVRDRYTFLLNLTDYAGAAVSGANVSLYRPSTTTVLTSNVSNASGIVQLYVNRRMYDFDFKISNDSVKIRNVNFTNWTTSNISFNAYGIAGEDLTDAVTLYEPFIGIAANSTGMSSNNMTAVFNYSGYNYDSPLALTIVKCSSWNYSDRSCAGSWSELTSERDADAKTVSGNASGFSAYFLSEDRCGNGACEVIYGETVGNCAADCTVGGTTTTTTISGGGGGGGGLSSADLAEIERIVKSFLDIGGIKLETTSIYKELFPGDTATVRVKLRNTLNSESLVSLKVTGDIIPLIFFEASNVRLAPSERRDISIRIIIPKFARTGDYDGDLVVTSGEEEGVIPFTIKVLPPEGKLLDVKIQPLTPTVAPGEILRLQVDLLNLGKTKKVDVQFDLQLIDVKTGEIVTRQEEAFAVETSLSTVKNLTVPAHVEPGRYMVKGVAYYSNVELEGTMQASSIAYVRVQYSFFKRKMLGVPLWIWWLMILLVGAAIGGYYLWNWLEYRKKRFKVKLDVRKLPQVGAHSEFVGKVAETGIRTFVDLNKLQMHTLIAGATGSGKTVAAQDIIEAALIKKKSVIIFDPTAQWTGFLRKCEDPGMLKRYKYFDMKTKQARAFDGSIKTIHDPYEMIEIEKYIDRSGEISIFNVSNLSPKEIDIVVASTIEQIFKSRPEESKELKTLIVYDEVHRLLPKFGGSGQGFIQLERGAREFRKWGIGLVLISQVLSDFVGEIKANIGTEVQMGTRYEGDLERVSMKYGDDVLKSVVKEPIGTGMNVNAEYNNGRPYFVSYRPLLHGTKRLTDAELKKYEKYFAEMEDFDFQAAELKKLKVDTMDVELEIKLSKAKVKSGQFQMADMYLETLRPKLIEHWKKLGKEPMHIVRKKITRAEVVKGIQAAKIERAKYIKKNPEKKVSFKGEVSKLKERMETLKKTGKNTSNVEIRVKSLDDRLKPFKGKIPSEDSQSIAIEVNELKKELGLIEKQKVAVAEKAKKVEKK
jgi:hypothetical protein